MAHLVKRLPVSYERPLGSLRTAGRLRRHVVQERLPIVVLGAGDEAGGGKVWAGGLVTGLKYGQNKRYG